MANINTTVGAAAVVAGGTGGSSMLASDKEVELGLEDEGEDEDEDEDGFDSDEEEDEQEEESEEEEEAEEEENKGENVDISDNGHWGDLPSSHYTDKEGDFDMKGLLESKSSHVFDTRTVADTTPMGREESVLAAFPRLWPQNWSSPGWETLQHRLRHSQHRRFRHPASFCAAICPTWQESWPQRAA